MPTTPRGWAASPRGRKELLAVALYCLAAAGMPLACTELYPFSRAPMFADAPRLYCDYHVRAPDGTELPPRDFGVQRNYWGNPVGVGFGFFPPDTVDSFGTVAGAEDVTRQVGNHLRRFPDLPWVEVTQEVVGPVDADHVGPVAVHRFRVANPAFPGAEP
jgi:hypothetical protein